MRTVLRRYVVALPLLALIVIAGCDPEPLTPAEAEARLFAVATAENWDASDWAAFAAHVEEQKRVGEFLAWVDSIVAPTGDLWDRVARCETGGDWGMKGSRYSGGVGFANSTWTAYRWDWMPANAGDANRAEQIMVAERVRWELRPYGSLRGKWGCGPTVGAP